MRNFCCCCRKKKKQSLETPSHRPVISIRNNSTSGGPKIIIVGAGVAGLACAVKLIDNGIENIKILEAENRVGGRIHTIMFGDNVIDLGAQFVHGEKNNVVYEMVEHMGLLKSVSEYYVSFQCIRSNGEIVNDDDTKRLKDVISNIFENLRSKMANFDGSLFEYLEDEFFDAMSKPENAHIDKAIAREFFENFARLESSESAMHLSEVSARGFLEYWECEGDYMLNWKERGFGEFIRILTRGDSDDHLGILTKKVVLGAKVQKIKWDQDDGKVSVVCENISQPFVADNVVITVSLGVLKKYAANMFVPPLPPTKMRAIEGLGYGEILKIYMEFPYVFWPTTWRGFTTLWTKEDTHELRMNGLLWLQEIFGFYCVHTQPLMLEAWAIGPEVQRFENLSYKDLQRQLMFLLRKFLSNWDIPEPTTILRTLWSNNENFCGAFSFRTQQTESFGTSSSELAKPLNTLLDVFPDNGLFRTSDTKSETSLRSTLKPTILFAGEATSTHYFSTVHGAVESGWREAKRLAGYYDSEI